MVPDRLTKKPYRTGTARFMGMLESLEQAAENQKRNNQLHEHILSVWRRTGVRWWLDSTYVTRQGNYKAVVVHNQGGRMVLRYSQNRWKKSD